MNRADKVPIATLSGIACLTNSKYIVLTTKHFIRE